MRSIKIVVLFSHFVGFFKEIVRSHLYSALL